MRLRWDVSFWFGWGKVAGLACLCVGNWAFHVGVRRPHWHWGRSRWPDSGFGRFGLGPLLLVTWF